MFLDDVRIVPGGRERVVELEPLFRELHAHHVAVAPRLGGLEARSPEEAWRLRCVRYEAWLAHPDAFLLVAERAGRAVGSALVGTAPGYQTWDSAERVGELHELVVAAAERRKGIGAALLDAVEQRLAAAGLREYRLLAIVANDDARGFYERRGLARVSDVMLRRIAAPGGVATVGADAPGSIDGPPATPRWRTATNGAIHDVWADGWLVSAVAGGRPVAHRRTDPPPDATPIGRNGVVSAALAARPSASARGS